MNKGVYFQINFADSIVFLFYILANTLYIIHFTKKSLQVGKIFIGISIVHLLMTVYYVYYAMNNGTDAYRYYVYYLERTYLKPDSLLSAASTELIRIITYPLVHYLKVSMWGATFIYSFCSLSGYFIIISILEKLKLKNDIKSFNNNYYLILMLPMLHFFTLPIGKDSLLFLFIPLALYGILFRKIAPLIIGLLCVGVIRPHIFIFLMAGIGVSSIFFNKNIPLISKVMILLIGVIGIGLALPFFLSRIGLENISVENVGNTIDTFSKYNQGADSSVDLSNANLLVKILSYLFRPLFFDARSVLQLAASLENVAWIFIVGTIFFKFKKVFTKKLVGTSVILFISFLFILIALASVVNNLGLAMRQKAMFFPMLFILFMLSSAKFEHATEKIEQ